MIKYQLNHQGPIDYDKFILNAGQLHNITKDELEDYKKKVQDIIKLQEEIEKIQLEELAMDMKKLTRGDYNGQT